MHAHVSSVQNIRFAAPSVETSDSEVGDHRNGPAGVPVLLKACTRTDGWDAIALRAIAMGLCLMSLHRLVRTEQAIVGRNRSEKIGEPPLVSIGPCMQQILRRIRYS